MPSERVSDRLLLREWVPGDLDALTEIFSQREVWHYPLRRGFTPQETADFLARRIQAQELDEVTPLATEDRATHQLLGYIGLSVPSFLPEIMPAVEIGWRLDPRAWGRGLATEGARVVLGEAFEERNLENLVSIYEPDNGASGRVMVHLGMEFDRDTVDPVRDLPLRVYRLARAQWVGASTRIVGA